MSRRLTPGVYFDQIYDAVDSGQYDLAEELCKRPEAQKYDLTHAILSFIYAAQRKYDLALPLARRIAAKKPSEEQVVRILGQTFRKCLAENDFAKLYEGIIESGSLFLDPVNVQQELFHCYSRLSDYSKMQQSAQKLYKCDSNLKYLFWSVTCMLMKPDLPQAMLTVAEKTISKVYKELDEKRFPGAEELELYVTILVRQGKFKETIEEVKAINSRDSSKYRLNDDVHFKSAVHYVKSRKQQVHNILLDLYLRCEGMEPLAIKLAKQILTKELPDQWNLYELLNILALRGAGMEACDLFLGSPINQSNFSCLTCFDTVSTNNIHCTSALNIANELNIIVLKMHLSFLLEQQAKNPRLRGPFLAELRLLVTGFIYICVNKQLIEEEKLKKLEEFLGIFKQSSSDRLDEWTESLLRSEIVVVFQANVHREFFLLFSFLTKEYIDKFNTKYCCFLDVKASLYLLGSGPSDVSDGVFFALSRWADNALTSLEANVLKDFDEHLRKKSGNDAVTSNHAGGESIDLLVNNIVDNILTSVSGQCQEAVAAVETAVPAAESAATVSDPPEDDDDDADEDDEEAGAESEGQNTDAAAKAANNSGGKAKKKRKNKKKTKAAGKKSSSSATIATGATALDRPSAQDSTSLDTSATKPSESDEPKLKKVDTDELSRIVAGQEKLLLKICSFTKVLEVREYCNNQLKASSSASIASSQDPDCTISDIMSFFCLSNMVFSEGVGGEMRTVLPGDEALIVASALCRRRAKQFTGHLEAPRTFEHYCFMLQWASLLVYAVHVSSHCFSLRVDLIEVSRLLSCSPEALHQYYQLSAKYIQADSLSYLVVPMLLESGLNSDCQRQFRAISSFNQSCRRDSLLTVGQCFDFGNYCKALEIAQFAKASKSSIALASASVEGPLLELLFSCFTVQDIKTQIEFLVKNSSHDGVSPFSPMDVDSFLSHQDFSLVERMDDPPSSSDSFKISSSRRADEIRRRISQASIFMRLLAVSFHSGEGLIDSYEAIHEAIAAQCQVEKTRANGEVADREERFSQAIDSDAEFASAQWDLLGAVVRLVERCQLDAASSSEALLESSFGLETIGEHISKVQKLFFCEESILLRFERDSNALRCLSPRFISKLWSFVYHSGTWVSSLLLIALQHVERATITKEMLAPAISVIERFAVLSQSEDNSPNLATILLGIETPEVIILPSMTNVTAVLGCIANWVSLLARADSMLSTLLSEYLSDTVEEALLSRVIDPPFADASNRIMKAVSSVGDASRNSSLLEPHIKETVMKTQFSHKNSLRQAQLLLQRRLGALHDSLSQKLRNIDG